MRLARITGRVSASVKSGGLAGHKMLLADYVGPDGGVLEPAAVVTDACGAGPGDLVLVAAGSAARIPAETAGVPTDATAVAFIDQLSVGARNVDLADSAGPPPSAPAPNRRRSSRQDRGQGQRGGQDA